MSELYRAVFRGEIDEGFDEQEVKKNIAKLLKKDLPIIEKLFDGNTHVIKKDIDAAGCENAKRLFGKYGAICHIIEPKDGVDSIISKTQTENAQIPPAQSVSAIKPDSVGEAKEKLSKKISEISAKLKPGISEAKERATEKLSNVSEQLKPGLEEVKVKISATFTEASDSIKTDLESGGMKSLFKNKFAIGGAVASCLIVLLLVIIFAGGNNSAPDRETIKRFAIEITGILPPGYEIDKYYEVKDFKITNKFTKKINNENVFVYETEYRIKDKKTGEIASKTLKQDDVGLIHFTYGLTKRGEKWYLVR